jgi:hypothetical protein
MNPTMAEETKVPEPATEEQPKAIKKASGAPRRGPVAPAKAKAGKKAKAAEKAPKTPKSANKAGKKAAQAGESREGSKMSAILELLKRPGGSTAKELMKATGWQPHSVRGFLSGTLRKKMGLEVISTKSEDGERTYSVKS